MLNKLLDRLLGRQPVESADQPVESVDDERSEEAAVEQLGGFDPEELVEDDSPQH
jgi:hypothetical protein